MGQPVWIAREKREDGLYILMTALRGFGRMACLPVTMNSANVSALIPPI